MRSRTEPTVTDADVSHRTVAIVVLSLLVVFRTAESRWCFHLDHVNRECVETVKAEKGLNGGAEGGFSSNQTLHDLVVLSGCFQVLLRESQDGCIDASFLGDFYSCVYNHTTDMKEELNNVNLTSLESAKELRKSIQVTPTTQQSSAGHFSEPQQEDSRMRAPRSGKCSTTF
ncbi:hypothetical protein MTO96_001527 [Rhipicephalus appendiculatus]